MCNKSVHHYFDVSFWSTIREPTETRCTGQGVELKNGVDHEWCHTLVAGSHTRWFPIASGKDTQTPFPNTNLQINSLCSLFTFWYSSFLAISVIACVDVHDWLSEYLLKLYKKSINSLKIPVRWNVGTWIQMLLSPVTKPFFRRFYFLLFLPNALFSPPLLQIVPPSMRRVLLVKHWYLHNSCIWNAWVL